MVASPKPVGSAVRRRRQRFWLGLAGGIALTVAVGLAGIYWPLTRTLDHWSFDLPFLWRSPIRVDDFVVVHMDAGSAAELGQPLGAAWDRRRHAQLIDRLTDEGARLIVYDVLFLTPGPDAAADAELERAIRRNQRVVLAGGHRSVATIVDGTNRLYRTLPLPPLRRFREAARAWGTAAVRTDVERASYVRRIPQADPDTPDVIPLALAAARQLSSATNDAAGLPAERWINFVGPPGTFPTHTFSRALQQPGHYASNKVVFVGALPERGFFDEDTFATPYCRVGMRRTPGVELHAAMVSNLVRNDWLLRASTPVQATLATLFGILLGGGCVLLNPRRAALYALGSVALTVGASAAVVWTKNIWWSWLVPVAMQAPVAFIWGVGYRYFVVDQRSRRLKQAFNAYLSPVMAEQLAEQDELLQLGGREVEATVMFTDLEGFTSMSESLPPAEVSRILIEYFNRATQGILAEDGTIIKYIGDAVMAVWGAPVPDARHAERAVVAAVRMREAAAGEIAGRRLRTRIGVNTGMVLAGNLGSTFRFDYTLIGDTTNFASRLEGLNKHLGTDILISETTRAQAGKKIRVRALGRFVVAGKRHPVTIYEVLGLANGADAEPEWVAKFHRALECFARREFDEAEKLLTLVPTLRQQRDGPAEFYLKEIGKARLIKNVGANWAGTIVLDMK